MSDAISKPVRNAITILRALDAWDRLDVGGIEIAMSEDSESIGVIMTKDGEEILMRFDYDLSDFLKHCGQMSEEESVSLAASIALKRLNRKDRS